MAVVGVGVYANRAIGWLLPARLRDASSDEGARGRVAIGVLLFTLVATLVVGAVRVLRGHDAPLAIPVALSVVGLLALYRRTGRTDLIGHAVAALIGLAVVALTVLAGGTRAPAFFAMALVPLFGTFLAGRRAGLAWAGIALLFIIAIRAYELSGWAWPVETQPGRTLPIVGNAVITLGVLVVALAYDWARTRDAAVLARQAADIEAVVGAIPDALVTIDASGRCVSVRGRGASEAPFVDAVGRAIAEVLEDEEGDVVAALERVHETGRASVQVTVAERALEIRLGALPGRAAIAVVRDVTVARRMEAQLVELEMRSSLERADRMSSIGLLAAGMAHEINNPLAYLAANLAYLEDAAHVAGSEAEAALADAREAADRIRGIVHDFKQYARREEDGSDEEPVRLADVVSSALRITRNELSHRAAVKVEIDGDPIASGSEPRLVQVVVNLLVNAAHALPPGAARDHEVSVRVSSDADYARLEIRDDGVGMAPDVLAQIMQPFFTTKPPGVGTGLGLAVCDAIVAQLGGRLEIESEVGVGTTARVLLRRGVEEELPRPSQEPPGPVEDPRAVARILVVDDEDLVRRALRRLLRRHDIVEASSGAAALEVLRTDREFDLILCDVMMPDVTGLELHGHLAAELPDLLDRVVFMTGGAFDEEVGSLFGVIVPSCRVIQKPFRREVLQDVVREQMSRAS